MTKQMTLQEIRDALSVTVKWFEIIADTDIKHKDDAEQALQALDTLINVIPDGCELCQ